jgi:hypothetical protein
MTSLRIPEKVAVLLDPIVVAEGVNEGFVAFDDVAVPLIKIFMPDAL